MLQGDAKHCLSDVDIDSFLITFHKDREHFSSSFLDLLIISRVRNYDSLKHLLD
jgi:hypothetical protein